MVELAVVAVEIPKREATGLAQTPTQAPLLQQAKNKGNRELTLPMSDVQIDFSLFIIKILYISKHCATSLQRHWVMDSPLLLSLPFRHHKQPA